MTLVLPALAAQFLANVYRIAYKVAYAVVVAAATPHFHVQNDNEDKGAHTASISLAG